MPTLDFEFELELAAGSNTIVVTAEDEAGLTGSDSVTVNNSDGPDPRDYGDLAFWVRASDLVDLGMANDDPVALWADVRGGIPRFTQEQASLRPILKTNVLNGHAVVQFDGAEYLFSPEMDWNAYSVFAVARSTGGTGQQHILSIDETPRKEDVRVFLFRYFDTTTFRLTAISDPFAATNRDRAVVASDWSILGGIRGASSLEARVNGGSTSGAAVAAYAASQQVHLGVRSDIISGPSGPEPYTDFLTGQIAEIFAYQRAVTGAEAGELETYLSLRYGITI